MDIQIKHLPLATWTNKVLLAGCAYVNYHELVTRLLDT